MSVEKEFVKLYGIAEEVLAGSIPHLDKNEITKFISQNNWLIIPTTYERDRKDSIIRSDPNIYFDLSEEGRIHVGFFCNTLGSVRRIRNLLHGFHTVEKEDFLHELRKLDKRFRTLIQRKIKEHHYSQTPQYATQFEFPTNTVDEDLLSKVFHKVDRMLEESDELMRIEGKSWRTLAPVVDIAHIAIERDENDFREVLRQLKPAYQIALRIKTDEEIEREVAAREKKEREEKQLKFREFVKSLKEKGIRGKEYREAVERWNRESA